MVIKKLFEVLLSPKSRDRDEARREFILNILLCGSIVINIFALVVAFLSDLHSTNRDGNSLALLFIILIFFISNYYFASIGKSRAVSYIFITFYYIVTTQLVFNKGADVPQALLIFALTIVMAGILINSRFAISLTVIIALTLFCATYLGSSGKIAFDTLWKSLPASFFDTIITVVTFLIIAVVSWLFNSESEKALERARISEADLIKERDLLEITVEKRTMDLKNTQAEKFAQLYRFAELGKLSSGLLHELSNAVSLISINLKQLEKSGQNFTEIKDMVSRATIGTNRLISYIEASRKQVNNQEILEKFSVSSELIQAVEMFAYKAKKAKVQINISCAQKICIYGNPIKFHQLLSNFVSNAIDSYDGTYKKNKQVNITANSNENTIVITISDFGKGISAGNVEHIFEPFFTTKGFKKGTGLGLSISKNIIVNDFHGDISVLSTPKVGSTFTIQIPKQKKV